MSNHKFVKAMKAGLLLAGSSLLLMGCLISQKLPEKFYYTLQEDNSDIPADIIREKPLAMSAWITETDIAATYRKKQIVQRHEGPRISFMESHLWADDLSTKIPSLIGSRLVASRLFEKLIGKNTFSRPELEISSFIKRLEFKKTEGKAQAIVSFSIQLWELQGAPLVTTEMEGTFSLKDDRLESFVEKINQTILETCDQFSRDVQEYYEPETTE